jgi:zinc transport system substrate-binding protein
MKHCRSFLFIISCICLAGSAAVTLSACKANSGSAARISIVCTTFPQYDWARIIIGEKAGLFELTYLMNTGVDLHSYVPSFDDSVAVLKSDLVILVGAGTDPWILALEKTNNKQFNRLSIANVGSLLSSLSDHHDYDEHVWLSLKNAALCVDAAAEKIIALEPANAEYYRANADAYIEKLNALDAQYAAAVNAPNARDTVIIADRFPFLYMFTDYGVNHYAAFDSCSAASDVPVSRISYLVEKVNEFGIKVILQIEGSSSKCAEMIRRDSNANNQVILTMHSIQSVSQKDIADGFTYLGAMTDNLTVFQTALQP